MAEIVPARPGRLDVVLAEALGLTRAETQRAISDGRVLVDGAARAKSHRLEGSEQIEIDLGGFGALEPDDAGVEVRYRDEHLLVVSKPPGVPTHPTENRRTGTLVNRLIGMGVPLSGAGGPLRPGIVHRLDAGTSGLIVVASDDQTHQELTELFRRHAVDRRYIALVRGAVAHDRFEVDAPLRRARARIRVDRAAGRRAETSFDTVERLARATLLEAAPRTGRTHQIRVHLAAVGHPILGDVRYGGGGDDAKALGLTRPFLHSARLSFEHPITGRQVSVGDPLPDDLAAALELARAATA
ncbi:MAG TPA: RluA family pseudouridine synthase [Actinomycetota bacterium]|nr:RluA family pseudouridine synthase [Actinomycetota bacterium]